MSWLSEPISSPFIYNSKELRYLASWPKHIKASKFGEEKGEWELCMLMISIKKYLFSVLRIGNYKKQTKKKLEKSPEPETLAWR